MVSKQTSLRMYDGLPVVEAVYLAWVRKGNSNPLWHERCQHEIRMTMPILARALDRLAQEKNANYR